MNVCWGFLLGMLWNGMKVLDINGNNLDVERQM